MKAPRRAVLAFIEPRAEETQAASALQVARAHLEAGRDLVALRRLRLLQITGAAGDGSEIAARLHGSIQFYNPAKERCTVSAADGEAVPLGDDETLVLVTERGGERRPAAERWWRHETGERVEVREGTLWALRFAPGADARAAAAALAVTRDRRHGLLANPHAQDYRLLHGEKPPLDWLTQRAPREVTRRRRSA